MRHLLAAPGAVGLTAKIPDGMRAVAVETNDVTNVSGFLFPGCHVDVLVTFQPESGRARSGRSDFDGPAERRGTQHRREDCSPIRPASRKRCAR